MMASSTRHPFPVPVRFPLKAQPGLRCVPSGADVHSLSCCHSCGCFPRTPPSESHVFKGLVHDTPEHGFILQHTSVCRQKSVPPTEPGSWLQPGLHGSKLCRKPSLGLTIGGSTSRVWLADVLGRWGGAHGLTQTGSHQREATSCTRGLQAGLYLGGFRGRGARLMLFPLRL